MKEVISSKKVLFLGSKEFGLRFLRELFKLVPRNVCGVVTVDDSQDVRSNLDDFRGLCDDYNQVLEFASNDKELQEIVSRLNPDICFVVGWYFIISKEVLDSVPDGFIGLHNSKLPAYRGQAPLVWQIINGEKTAGFSFFSLGEGMDEGDIWYQGNVKIEDDDYIIDVIEKIECEIIDFLDLHLGDILSGKIRPSKQKKTGVSYAGKRTAEDGVIDWNQNNVKIFDFIRAQTQPYPGAFSFYKGEKMIIYKAFKCEYPVYGIPGEIIMINKFSESIIVSCGERTGIEISDVEYLGKRVKATDCIKSIKYRFSANSLSKSRGI